MRRMTVQEDQAEGLGPLYQGLYTVDEGFQAPFKHTMNPKTAILVVTHPNTTILGMSHDIVHVIPYTD